MAVLILFCKKQIVGEICDAFCQDDTWYGLIAVKVNASDSSFAKRICEYIHFCEKWNESILTGKPCHAEKFENYKDLMQKGGWKISGMDGFEATILDAPVFFPGNEVSWKEDRRR